jgi:hypothetical protein
MSVEIMSAMFVLISPAAMGLSLSSNSGPSTTCFGLGKQSNRASLSRAERQDGRSAFGGSGGTWQMLVE